MKMPFPAPVRLGALSFFGCCCSTAPLHAEQFGLFTYTVVGGTTVTITRYPTSAAGSVEIPEVIDAKPVTAIGAFAFENCAELTNVTIPFSVTTIGGSAFEDCIELTSVAIPSSVTSIGAEAFYGCTKLISVSLSYGLTTIGDRAFNSCFSLSSVTIPSSVTTLGEGAFAASGLKSVTLPSSITSMGRLVFSDCSALSTATIADGSTSIGNYAFIRCAGLRSVSIPASVTSIGELAFRYCDALTNVTIPAGVTSIGASAFEFCTNLTSATFLGNAPATFGSNVFSRAGAGFRVYYRSSRTGFSSPTWQGYPATGINEGLWPAGVWLAGHGYPHNTNLNQTINGGGMSLLMAYALNLDPRNNPVGRLPAPVVAGNTLSISFHATTPGIAYRVETSTGLDAWSTNGVTQSAPGPDGRSTATVNRDAPSRSLRLVVGN